MYKKNKKKGKKYHTESINERCWTSAEEFKIIEVLRDFYVLARLEDGTIIIKK